MSVPYTDIQPTPTFSACISFLPFQFSLVTQMCPTPCNPMDCSTTGLPVHHQLPELTQTHVHRVGDAIQPSHSLLSPSPPAFDLSQNQGLFERISSSHQVAKVLEYSPSQMPANCFWASLAWMGLLLTNTSYSIISTLLSSPPTLHHPKYC